jgi:hypothetical protein
MFILAGLVFSPVIVSSQVSKDASKDSHTLDVIMASPGAFEQTYGTVLYTGALNAATDKTKELQNRHAELAEETVNDIERLRFKMEQTRRLNQEYLDSISKQLEIWKAMADKDPSLKPVLSREIELFNIAIQFQLEENIKWSAIDGVIAEIEELGKKSHQSANKSFTRSNFYTKLVLLYLDLVEFYKNKYKELITFATLYHAYQQNPNLKLADSVLSQVKPYHEKELVLSKNLLYDLDDNFSKLRDISQKANQLKEFYYDLDKFSLSEVNKLLENLRYQADTMKASQHQMLANVDMLPVIEGYIDYYETLKVQLEEKMIADQINDAVLLAMYDKELTRIAYTGMLYPGSQYGGFGSWVSSAWEGVKTGTKVATGAVFAAADYATGKTADLVFEAVDKTQAAYNHGLFSDEYRKFSQAYDEAGEKIYTVSIKDTFKDPLMATLRGDDKQGLGQSAVNKAQQSFEASDKYLADLTGSNFASQVIMNTVTCGGYGLAKDVTTLNDANASTGQKIVAGAGVVLALAPVLSGAKTASEGTKGASKSLVKSVGNVADDVGSAVTNVRSASGTLQNATRNLAQSTDDMIRAAGPNFRNADILDQGFNAVAQNFDNAIISRVSAQQAYNQARNQLNQTIKNNLTRVPADTVKGGASSALSGFIADHSLDAIGGRLRDLYSNSLSQAIKNAEPILGQTLGQAVGIKDIANFTLTNFINNNVTGGITTMLDGILNSDKNNQSQQGSGSSSQVPQPPGSPVSNMPGQNVVPLVPSTGAQPSQMYPPPSNLSSQPPMAPPGYFMPPGMGIPPGVNLPPVDPNLLGQYLSGIANPNQNTGQGYDPGLIDQTISQLQANQSSYDQNRGADNQNNPYVTMIPDRFNTDPNAGSGQGQSTIDRVQNISQQTMGPKPVKPTKPPSNNTKPSKPNPSTPPPNIPIGDGIPEVDRTNGIDDDNDGVIDEGPATGNCQIAIHDTGGDKDDQWELKLNGKSIGRNSQGKTRFWDFNLKKGQHKVSATGVDVPDNVGTYTIWFGTCSSTGGPPLSGNNLNNGTTFTWTVNVP